MSPAASDLPHLDRLHRWLTLGSGAGVVGLAGCWLLLGLLTMALGVAAVGVTPVLLVAVFSYAWVLKLAVMSWRREAPEWARVQARGDAEADSSLAVPA